MPGVAYPQVGSTGGAGSDGSLDAATAATGGSGGGTDRAPANGYGYNPSTPSPIVLVQVAVVLMQ